MTRVALLGGLLWSGAADHLAAQEPGAVWLALAGFSARLGVDFTGDEQAVLGVGLDLGDLGSPRFRLRPSLEMGLDDDQTTYVANVETVLRFAGDGAAFVPYVGVGFAVFTQRACGDAEGCPAVWLQFPIGAEFRLRRGMNWLVEYHAEDAFDRHRFFLGLTTRRGG